MAFLFFKRSKVEERAFRNRARGVKNKKTRASVSQRGFYVFGMK